MRTRVGAALMGLAAAALVRGGNAQGDPTDVKRVVALGDFQLKAVSPAVGKVFSGPACLAITLAIVISTKGVALIPLSGYDVRVLAIRHNSTAFSEGSRLQQKRT